MRLRSKVAVVAMFATGGLLAALVWQFVPADLWLNPPLGSAPAFFGVGLLNLLMWGLVFSGAMVLAGANALSRRLVVLLKPISWVRTAAATMLLASAFSLGAAVFLGTYVAALPFLPPFLPDNPDTAPPPTALQKVLGASIFPLGAFLAGVIAALTCACAFWVLGAVRPRKVATCSLGLGCVAAVLSWSSVRFHFDLWLVGAPIFGVLVGYWFCGEARHD